MVLHKRTSPPQTNLWLAEGIWCLRIQVVVEDAIELETSFLSSAPLQGPGGYQEVPSIESETF